MKNKKVRLLLATITTIAMILGCLVVPSGEVSEAASKKLKVSCKKTVAVNCTTTIKTNVKAKFKSLNKKIATVSSKGVVKGKKAGKVKITVTSKSNKKNKKTVTITVKNQLVITAPSGSKATLYVGETTKIKANLSSKFKSSNTSVATVSSSGKVVAKKVGTAKITVTSKSNKKLKKTVTITVKEKPEEKTEATTENKTTENNTTEDKTTEQPSTSTTEEKTDNPTTEEPNTTEQPSTENPEEKKIVGIEANYGTNKVPYFNVDYLFYETGIDITLIYDDGTEGKMPFNKAIDIEATKINTETVDYGAIVTYNVSYEEFTDEMTIEYIYTDHIYPLSIALNPADNKKEQGIELSPEDYTASVTYSDDSYKDIDNSECRYAYMWETEENKYGYIIGYDYYFTDSNGNDLYAFQFDYLYLSHR